MEALLTEFYGVPLYTLLAAALIACSTGILFKRRRQTSNGQPQSSSSRDPLKGLSGEELYRELRRRRLNAFEGTHGQLETLQNEDPARLNGDRANLDREPVKETAYIGHAQKEEDDDFDPAYSSIHEETKEVDLYSEDTANGEFVEDLPGEKAETSIVPEQSVVKDSEPSVSRVPTSVPKPARKDPYEASRKQAIGRLAAKIVPPKQPVAVLPEKSEKRKRAPSANRAHDLLERIFRVTLTADRAERGGFVHLDDLAAALTSCPDAAVDRSPEGGQPEILLDVGALDRIILDRLSIPVDKLPLGEPKSGLEYLVESFRRCDEEARRLPSYLTHLQPVIAESRTLIASYVGVYLLQPELFGPRSKAVERPIGLLKYLRAGITIGVDHLALSSSASSSRSLPPGFLDAVLNCFGPDDFDSVDALLTPSIDLILAEIRASTLTTNFQPWLALLTFLARDKRIAGTIVRHPDFLPDGLQTGRDVETRTLLGAVLRIGCGPDAPDAPAIAASFFANPLETAQTNLTASMHSLQRSIRVVASGGYELVLALCKASPPARGRCLDWFAALCRLNAPRSKLRFDINVSATHALMLNACSVMLDMCRPFLDAGSAVTSSAEPAPTPGPSGATDTSDVDGTTGGRSGHTLGRDSARRRIDSAYLFESARINITDDTKLAVSSQDLDSWVDKRNGARVLAWRNRMRDVEQAQGGGPEARSPRGSGSDSDADDSVDAEPASNGNPTAPREFNFVTECFFLTARCIHLGLAVAARQYQDALRDVSRAYHAYVGARDGNQRPPGDRLIDDTKQQVEVLMQKRLLLESHFMEPEMSATAGRFIALMVSYLLDLIDPQRVGPGSLPSTPPMEFASLPEHFVDDIVYIADTYVLSHPSATVVFYDPAALVNLAMYVCGTPSYLRNPYVRSSLAALVAHLMQPRRITNPPQRPLLSLGELDNMPVAREHMFPSLTRLYVDMEHTGSHTQFFDKFNTRHNISRIFQEIWPSHHFLPNLRRFYAADPALVIRFVNMLVNDAIFLLEESMQRLQEIRTVQQEMRRTDEWMAQDPAIRAEREQFLTNRESMVTSELRQGNDNAEMLLLLSRDLPDPLLSPEMVDRVATMLNSLLNKLAGSQCVELKVENPSKYNWEPRVQLARVMKTYLALAKGDVFVYALIRDERFFDVAVMRKAFDIAKRPGVRCLDEMELNAWRALLAAVEASVEQVKATQLDLSDVPDEFLDPITCDIMTDPVILPTSGKTCDRAVILRHLLTDENDPFNRLKLTPDMLEPNEELRRDIQAYLNDRRAKMAARSAI